MPSSSLRLAHGAQRRHRQHLGLPSGEHARAVHPGQQADLGRQRTQVMQAAPVHSLALVKQRAAHHMLLGLIQRLVNERQAALVHRGKVLFCLFRHLRHAGVAHRLVVVKKRPAHLLRGKLLH